MSISRRLTAPLRHLAGLLGRPLGTRSKPRSPAKSMGRPARRRALPSARNASGLRQDAADSRHQSRAVNGPVAPKAEGKTAIVHRPLQRWGETPAPPPVRWVVEGLILAGAFNVIAGAPGVGKTSLTMYLAACVAEGEDFLGRSTQQGNVLFVNFDDPNEAISRRFFEMACNDLGCTPRYVDTYAWSPERNAPDPDDVTANPFRDLEAEPVIEEVIAEIRHHQPTLIIIDSYSAAFPRADGNRGEHVMRTDRVLRRLLRETDGEAAIVIIDHTPKPTTSDGQNTARGVSGSQQKHARARTVHLILPGESVDDTADSLHWMVHKSNASRAGFGFGIQRVLDEERGRLTFTAVDLPDAARPKQAEALPVILNLLRNEEGRNVRKKELVERVRGVIDVSERTVRSVLESDKFQAHPNVERMQLAGRGSPVAFRWVDVTAGERCSSG